MRRFKITRLIKGFILLSCISIASCQVTQSRFFTSSQHIATNQIGYLNNAKKVAIYSHANPFALRWELYDANTKALITKGNTRVFGKDEASQQHVHQLDFSEVRVSGTYYLQVGSVKSQSFKINTQIYANLYKDAFRYFYFHRLGADIQSEFLHHPEHAHAALHVNDTDVKCLDNWCGNNVKQNVVGAWADAGDFGIYPVNHAIAVWTLANSYEYSPSLSIDDNLHLPESGNKIPDVLDELQYGSHYLSGMLPPGKQLASHKVSSHHWSPFITSVERENSQERFLQPPSTAATLAVVRSYSQLARLYMNYDKKYSEKVWQVAKDAIRRASQNKTIYYSEDTKDSPGAGDYADKDLTDDWYAALSEALITASLFHETANAKTFRERVRQNRYFLTFDNEGSQSWASAQGAASLSLWLHWDITGLNYLEKDILQQNILESASGLLTDQQQSGFNTLYKGSYTAIGDATDTHKSVVQWQWGSNSIVVNKMIILAYAYRITLDHTYLHAFFQAFDYLLGTNALNKSFVTGYGFNAETDTHDRLAWTHYQNKKIPYPPGWLAGGPMNQVNACEAERSTPTDKAAALAYAPSDTAPTAWCSKENAINWNAPLYWVSKFAVHASNAMH